MKVNAVKDSIEQELSSPMTLAIPYSGTSLTLFSLTEKVAENVENLCIIFKSRDDKLFVFRNTDKLLTVVDSENKVKIKVRKFGIFQLIYCGVKDISTFGDAGSEGISGVPPGADESTFSSYGKEEASLTIQINSEKYAFGGNKFCAILAKRDGTDRNLQNSGIEVLLSEEVTHTNSGNVSINFTVNTKELADEAFLFLSLLAQESTASCAWNTGDTISSHPDFVRAFLFKVSKREIHAGTASGTLGEGRYELQAINIDTGPEAAEMQDHLSEVTNICIKTAFVDENSNELSRIFVNAKIADSALGRVAVVDAPTAGTSGASGSLKPFTIELGRSCQEADTIPDFSNAHRVVLSTPDADGTYYLTPVSIDPSQFVSTADLDQVASALGAAVTAQNFCLEIYPGNFTSSTTTAESVVKESLGRWKFSTDSPAFQTYLPWDLSKKSGGKPILDVLVHLGSDCVTGFPSSSITPVVKNDYDFF